MAIITKDGKLTNTQADNNIVEEFLKSKSVAPIKDPNTNEVFAYMPFVVTSDN